MTIRFSMRRFDFAWDATIWRWLALTCLVAFLSISLLRSDFIKKPFSISHDTFTYTNLPGIAAGLSLSNFSSPTRTPGYSLFLAIVTWGELPKPDAIKYSFCEATVYTTEAEDCSNIRAKSQAGTTVRKGPLLYQFSPTTDRLLQRAISVSRALFVASFIWLFWSLSFLLHPILALSVVLALWIILYPDIQSILDVVMTESLFPTVLFFYVGCMAMYFAKGKGIWLLLASSLAAYSFLIRPSLLYLPVAHLLFILHAFFWRRSITATLFSGGILIAPVVWALFFSQLQFFDVANFGSQSLRMAMFADQNTIDCVKGEELKTVFKAYVRSMHEDPVIKQHLPSVHTDIDRYYLFGATNMYRLEWVNHPIYQEAEIKPFLNSGGLLPYPFMLRMIDASSRCNLWRNINFSILTTKMILGLTPVLTVWVPRNFFNYPHAFLFSATAIVLALGLLWRSSRHGLFMLIILSVTAYFCTVFIVAAKQGGEGRYTDIVEPIFIFAAGVACAVLIESVLTGAGRIIGCRKQASTLPSHQTSMVRPKA